MMPTLLPGDSPADASKQFLFVRTYLKAGLDVEIVFLYPFTLVFRDLGFGGIVAIAVFLLVLLVPFAYLLSVGALEWGPRRRWSSSAGAPMQRSSVMQRLSEALAARDSDFDENADADAGAGGTEPVPGKAA